MVGHFYSIVGVVCDMFDLSLLNWVEVLYYYYYSQYSDWSDDKVLIIRCLLNTVLGVDVSDYDFGLPKLE